MYPLAPATATRTRSEEATASALGVLELLPGARLTILLALTHPWVAREQAGLLEWRAELVVEARQGAREAVADGAGLTRRAAARNGADHVELADGTRHLEGLRDDHAQC